MSTRIPAVIGIDADGLTFEGKRFPFTIKAEPVMVEVDGQYRLSYVSVTLMADRVAIDPSLVTETDGDVTMVSEPESEPDPADLLLTYNEASAR